MKTVVFIKQVPDTDDVKWTEDNNIDRRSMESIMNPCDMQALQAALNFKEKYKSEIIAVSMGPDKAESVLKEAVAAGADDAVLLCDSKFAASDTCATSRILARAIEEKIQYPDIIFCGQHAIDGETSQTGPSVATRLKIPFITHVKEIIDFSNNKLRIKRETHDKTVEYEVEPPVLLCIDNPEEKPHLPLIDGYIKAHDFICKKYDATELNIQSDKTGVKGSPTYVYKVYKNNFEKDCKFIEPDENKSYVDEILTEITKVSEE